MDDFTADRSGVSLSAAGAPQLSAQLLVACDGAKSRIRGMAGIANVAWGYGQSGITFAVENQTRFSVQGIDKQLVGEVAANIRKLRKPDPYKAKGIRYAGEHIRRKVGKAGK